MIINQSLNIPNPWYSLEVLGLCNSGIGSRYFDMFLLNLSLKVKYQIFLLVFITSLILSDSNAQMKSGYRFGVNLTSMSIKNNGINIKPEIPFGVQFGAINEIQLTEKTRLQTGFLFTSKGTDYKINNIDYSIAPSYLEFPVNGVYYCGRRPSINLSFFGGPYFSGVFGGYKLEPTGEYKNLAVGSGENNDLKRLDIGFNLGAGLHLKGYVFSIQYGLGLRNVSPKGGLEMRNKVISISMGTLLPPKK